MDGKIEESFYRQNFSQWREEQAQIRARTERHKKADQNYIEQGIRLLEIARNGQEFYQTQGQAERAAFPERFLTDLSIALVAFAS